MVLADPDLKVVQSSTLSVVSCFPPCPDYLYTLIVPEALLTWQRVPVANRLALAGEDWTETHAKFNSGYAPLALIAPFYGRLAQATTTLRDPLMPFSGDGAPTL
jgi:hypothetical protein